MVDISKNVLGLRKLQGGDLNPRPPGYEPDELPGCSTLRQELLFSVMVEEGLEPSHLFRATDFKSVVSTDSTTRPQEH